MWESAVAVHLSKGPGVRLLILVPQKLSVSLQGLLEHRLLALVPENSELVNQGRYPRVCVSTISPDTVCILSWDVVFKLITL